MAGFIIFNKLNQSDAQKMYDGITDFFTKNPRRRVCITNLFKVRRGHVREDILLRSLPEVSLKEK